MGRIRGEISEEERLNSLKKVIQLLEKNNINYFLTFGTLLGVIREGKFIDGDSDIDIGVFNVNVIKKLEENFNSKNLFFAKNEENYVEVFDLDVENKLFNVGFYEFNEQQERVFVTINARKNLPARISNTIRYVLSGNPNKLGKLDERFMRKLVILSNIPFKNFFLLFFKEMEFLFAKKTCFSFDSIKTKETTFYDTEVRIPYNPEEHLNLFYGHNWRIPDYDFNNHGKEFENKINGIYICKIEDSRGEK